ncbi:hypothetical protein GFS03_03870 [Sulfolobus sp. E5-1-F]|uniref:hypothetical protein n=1 Tax=Sulfolobaceae TaxID=118883 RepID=UPI001296D5DB|nr:MULTISPECIES: hypothetical protein [unclassified Sulfolobus]QGA53783.1 hypothetical protein GFS03_03870 [Sulfolobus sp. E5-1-F]QGA68563.1 hypothetical protein GFS33_07340 [Sulfolobus sp. E11-6]
MGEYIENINNNKQLVLTTFSKPFLDVLGYSNPEEAFDEIYEQLKSKNKFPFLARVVSLHIDPDHGAPFWKEVAQKKGIYKKDVEALENDPTAPTTLYQLLGEANYSLLYQQDGYFNYFLPNSLKTKKDYSLFKSSSSGTTGKPKTVYHGLVPLLFSALNEYTGISATVDNEKLKDKLLLILGPQGAFVREHQYLADLLNMQYRDLSFDTTGLKLLPQEEVQKRIGNSLSSAIDLLNKSEVGLMTSTLSTISRPPLNELIKKRKPVLKVSGVEVDARSIIEAENYYGVKIIPMFGHFAGKSSIGFVNGDDIHYYSPRPFTYTQVISDDGDLVKYGEEGRILLSIIQPELLLINKEDVAKRIPPNYLFNYDGFSNPHRPNSSF